MQGYRLELDMEPLKGSIDELQVGLTDLRPVFDQFYKPAFGEYVQAWWASRGGGKWPGITGKYQVWKSKHGGGQLMVLAGNATDLKGSLMSGQIYRTSMYHMEIGATTPGYDNRPRGRQIIDAKAPQMRTAMERAMELHGEWLAEKWGRNGV